MRTASLCSVAAVAVVMLCAGCGSRQHNPPPQQQDPYASREPGSDVSPTSDSSFQLLGEDGPTRFAEFQSVLVARGKRCGSFTRAVLEGGLDGTDEWRVNCADSGRWQVWFRPDSDPDVDHCANAKCA